MVDHDWSVRLSIEHGFRFSATILQHTLQERSMATTVGQVNSKANVVYGKDGYLHVDLVGSIPPDHMLYHEVSARMLIFPRIQPQHHLLLDDNTIASGNEALDFSAGEEVGSGHRGGCSARRREDGRGRVTLDG